MGNLRISRSLLLIFILFACLTAIAGSLVLTGKLPFSPAQKKDPTPQITHRSGRILSAVPLPNAADAVTEQSFDPKLIVDSWQRIAADYNIAPTFVALTSSLMQDVLTYTHVVPDESSLQQFEKSLSSFLENFRFAFQSQKTAAGTAYWLTFCTVEAFRRAALPQTDSEETRREYDRFIDQIANMINHRVQIDLPPQQYQKMRSLVTQGLTKFRDETKRRITIYQHDFLCPAFRKPLDPKAAADILADYNDPNNFPKFDNPRVSMLVTGSEAWSTQYKSYIENHIGLCLFEMFLATLDFKLNINRYWGYMKYKAEGMNDPILVKPSCWPAFVQFVQDPEYNHIYHWKREVQ